MLVPKPAMLLSNRRATQAASSSACILVCMHTMSCSGSWKEKFGLTWLTRCIHILYTT